MNKREFLQVGLILYGIYVFDEFIVQIVSLINIVTGNYIPSKETAAGYAIFGVARLLVSMVLIFNSGKIAKAIFKVEENG